MTVYLTGNIESTSVVQGRLEWRDSMLLVANDTSFTTLYATKSRDKLNMSNIDNSSVKLFRIMLIFVNKVKNPFLSHFDNYVFFYNML